MRYQVIQKSLCIVVLVWHIENQILLVPFPDRFLQVSQSTSTRRHSWIGTNHGHFRDRSPSIRSIYFEKAKQLFEGDRPIQGLSFSRGAGFVEPFRKRPKNSWDYGHKHDLVSLGARLSKDERGGTNRVWWVKQKWKMHWMPITWKDYRLISCEKMFVRSD